MTARRPVRRPTENAAVCGKYAKPLPSFAILHVGFCSARAVNDRYGLRLFACAIARLDGERGE